MSKLEELLKELCPEGVSLYALKEIAELQRGTAITKNRIEEGTYPVVSGGREPAYYCNQSNRTGETITIAGSGAGAGFVQYWNEPIFVCDAFSIKGIEGVSTKYLFYCLENIQDRIYNTKKGGGVPHVHISDIHNFKLPIPPLPVQEEIVRILDSFTELTNELTNELTARKKQYEHYRDKLLRPKDNIEVLELGDVCTFVRGPFGGSLKKETFQKSGYAVYEQQNAIYRNLKFRYFIDENKLQELKRFEVNSGDLIVSCSGTIGKTYIIPENAPKGVINQALLKLTPHKKLDVFYLQFFFENTLSRTLNGVARGGAIKNVPSVNELKKLPIPLPTIEMQKKLVQVLDNFEAICSDLNIGLPAEIEARKKQYEFYRDTLLTFGDKSTTRERERTL